MLMLPDPGKSMDLAQLNDELQALDLPGFVGTARLSRKWELPPTDEEGVPVSNQGRWVPSAPYLLVKCEPLTTEQTKAVEAVIENHVARDVVPEEPAFSSPEREALRRLLP